MRWVNSVNTVSDAPGPAVSRWRTTPLATSLAFLMSVAALAGETPPLNEGCRRLVDGVNRYAYRLLNRYAPEDGNAVVAPRWVFAPLLSMHYASRDKAARQNTGQALARFLGIEEFDAKDLPLHPYIVGRRGYRGRMMGTMYGCLQAVGFNGTDFQKRREGWLQVAGAQQRELADPTAAVTHLGLNPRGATARRLMSLGQTRAFAIVARPTYRNRWLIPFDPDDNLDAPFATATGQTMQTTYMQATHLFPMLQTERHRLIGLPMPEFNHHDGDNYLIVIQRADGTAEQPVIENQTAWQELLAKCGELAGQENPAPLRLQVPKFAIVSELQLDELFTELGAGSAFARESSPFIGSLLSEPPKDEPDYVPPYLAAVAQVCEFAVGQAGIAPEDKPPPTLATLAWVPRPEPPTVRVDRPFVFVVYNTRDRIVNIAGRVRKPTLNPKGEAE